MNGEVWYLGGDAGLMVHVGISVGRTKVEEIEGIGYGLKDILMGGIEGIC